MSNIRLLQYFFIDSQIGTDSLNQDILPSADLESSVSKVVIAQWSAQQLETGEVPGSNPGNRDNLLISD